MVLNAYDVKVCMRKMIQISTNTCINVTKKHPNVTLCLFFLFIIYMCFPLFFWILFYSLPPAVSTWMVLSFRDSRRCTEECEKESELKGREGKQRIKNVYLRVHSVRWRKAKEIESGADPYAADKRNTIDMDDYADDEECNLTDVDKDVVDKKALIEGSPKEICQDISLKSGIYHNPEVVMSLKLLKDDEDVREETGKAMDMNIAKAERLESLIARRRSKKVRSQHAKRTLMKNDAMIGGAQMLPIVVPKRGSSSRSIAPVSPGPESAPSMLGPMRNPFDIPYDPQEEKPDLAGDNFQHEFASEHNKDFMFCRPESFSLGHSLPMDFFEDRDDAPLVDDFGFRRRQSSTGYKYPRPETEESDTNFGATTEAESGHEFDSGPHSKSNLESEHPNNDEIKEVIQVHKNGADNPSTMSTRNNALAYLSLSEASSGGSSDEDHTPVCKINREAILKSLSIRRNSVSIPNIKMENNNHLQENNLTYANSALENASRLKQQYFADKPQKRHSTTFSIASDMQVEVSELSSPPLTIGENMSYQDDASAYDTEMEQNTSWDGLDSWAGSSRLSEVEDNEIRPPRANEVGATRNRKFDDVSAYEKKQGAIPSSTTSKIITQTTSPGSTSPESSFDEDSSEEQFSATTLIENVVSNEPAPHVEVGTMTLVATDPNDPPQERVHLPTISPKSVLQPTLSVASFEHEDHEETRARLAGHSSSNASLRALGVQFTVGTRSNGVAESSQQKIEVNDLKLKKVVDCSTSETSHTRHRSCSSTSLSSDVDSSEMDYMKEDSKIQENNAFVVTNRIDKGKMVIEESSQEPNSETSSEDYDSEVEEHDVCFEACMCQNVCWEACPRLFIPSAEISMENEISYISGGFVELANSARCRFCSRFVLILGGSLG
ncbi:hypothetical protein AAHA92_25371 [Salvia divinorum]|uniref:Uncharacterized protein n=1 Tax=Salvia divinorum TaxID=28513 RepID=A0ABD1GAE7_SALDI